MLNEKSQNLVAEMRKVVLCSLKIIVVECLFLCFWSRKPRRLPVHSLQSSLASPSVGADSDRAPHPCFAQRVSCGSGLSGQCLSRERARMCDKRVERSVCLSMTAGTSQPIFFSSLKLARGFLCATSGRTRNG